MNILIYLQGIHNSTIVSCDNVEAEESTKEATEYRSIMDYASVFYISHKQAYWNLYVSMYFVLSDYS